jgi:hypothetical protein
VCVYACMVACVCARVLVRSHLPVHPCSPHFMWPPQQTNQISGEASALSPIQRAERVCGGGAACIKLVADVLEVCTGVCVGVCHEGP